MSARASRVPAAVAAALVVGLALCTYAEAHQGWGVRWAAPSLVKIGDCTEPRWRTSMRAAIADWNRAPNLTVRRAPCGSGRFSVHSGYYGQNWAGWADVDSLNGYRTGATVYLDTRYSRRPGVACHELGHALGLGHGDSPRSCLSTRIPRSAHPDDHDLQQLGRQYR